jgi:diaminopropionate ammonia-lyase
MLRQAQVARQAAFDPYLRQLVRSSIRYVFQPSEADSREICLKEMRQANDVVRSWPGYSPTPLYELPDLARHVGVRAILYKDESRRFGLNSFKPMGALVAVSSSVGAYFGEGAGSSFEGLRGLVAAHGPPFTVVCGGDGNHGRAVAWGAHMLGLPYEVLLHEHVSVVHARAISELRAGTHRVKGTYDDAVRLTVQLAEENCWHVISDTSYGGQEETAYRTMLGYAGIGAEVSRQIGHTLRPTHIVCQAGVGGLAASMFSYFSSVARGPPPEFVCAEPIAASCLLESALNGKPTVFPGGLKTIMVGLSCGEPSPLAWKRLRNHDCHFVAIPDECAAAIMFLVADCYDIVSGESGAAGLAALLCIALRPGLRTVIGLDNASVVLVIGTEGAGHVESDSGTTGSQNLGRPDGVVGEDWGGDGFARMA